MTHESAMPCKNDGTDLIPLTADAGWKDIAACQGVRD